MDRHWLEEEEFGAPDERVRQRRPEPGEDREHGAGLDVEDLRLDDPESWTFARREPGWVIKEMYEDEELGLIKTGKEAGVTLVRRTSGPRSCLLAVKTYRPRAQRAFRREESYRGGQTFNNGRIDRAVAKRSRFGRAILEYAWAYREFPLMRTAWEAGVSVPYPVETLSDGLVMEYVGDLERAAPRLSEVQLGQREAAAVFEELVENVQRLLDAYLVHADLSAFNVLYWNEKPWLIDFPQAVDIAHSEAGVEFLRRDLTNLCRHFRRYGVERDPGRLLEEVMQGAPFTWAGAR